MRFRTNSTTPSGITITQVSRKRQCCTMPQFDRSEKGGLDPNQLPAWSSQLQAWQQQTKRLVSDMVGCAWCGRIAMGGPHSLLRSHMRQLHSDFTPPAAAANPIMAAYMTRDVHDHDDPQPIGRTFWACQSCQTSENRRVGQNDLHTPW